MSFEQPDLPPLAPSDEFPILTPVAHAPITILSSNQSQRSIMSSPSSSSLPAPGVKQPNGAQPEDTTVQNFSASLIDETRLTGSEPDPTTPASSSSLRDVDPQIIEALRGKDRIYVLKLGELMESLINDERRQRMELAPTTSYQRLLVHRCSAYYKLTPEVDNTNKMIYVYSTAESRIPVLRISELVPPETTAAPAFKIMRRSSTDRRGKPPHQAGSVTGDDGDLSDLEPSETGSLGGRSNTTGGSAKKHMTIEQREAAYNEARSRIFMGFEEKEKAKDKDINSSSSSLSVASGSTKNGGSSAGDADSSSSSPATESEWSGPARMGEQPQNSGYASASSSTRSIRSSAYISNGSGSSRNSRAASPSSFHYPSLYEPNAPSMPLYDPSQQQHQHPTPAASIYHPPYGFPYSQGQPNQPNPPYMPYHVYYPPPYPPYSSPHPPQPASDPATPSGGEPYAPPPPMPYGPAYMWPHPGQPPVQSPPMQPPPVQSQQPPANIPHTMSPPPPGQPPYHSYMPPPPHSYAYPIPGYYPNQPQPGHPIPPPPPPPPTHPPHIPGPQLFDPKSSNIGLGNNTQTNGFRNSMSGNNSHPPPNSRTPQRNGYNGSLVGNGSKPRNGSGGGAVQPGRAPWSYGPGVGPGGMVTNPLQTTETVGPRLSNTRRQSNMSNSSMNGRSASGDDVSSVASSASSSSRKAASTVNTGSQHPLPPRPDWAINLKPHTNSRNASIMSSPISPPRSMSSGGVQGNYPSRQHPPHSHSNPPPLSLQSTDFPPLTSTSASMPPSFEQRRPTGAWGNTTSRPIFGQTNNVVMSPITTVNTEMHNRLEETGFERPPPKSAELYNPKTPKRTTLNSENNMRVQSAIGQSSSSEAASSRGVTVTTGEVTSAATIVHQVAALTLGNGTIPMTVSADHAPTLMTGGVPPSSAPAPSQ